MQPEQRERALVAVVDGLEAELRRMDLWEPEPPSEEQLASTQPFCCDTLALSQWLQWLLIPRMRRIFAGEGELPTASAIHPLAEDCFEHLDDARALLTLIDRFDRLIRGDAGALPH
ncbi:MAG TPA: YqcC family protein [Gammaproteobacteria bacterium]|nr:YqcC family protein [Gammaproteobacteria bacterium]